MSDAFRGEVLAGLALPRKTLSPKWFYDERGSALFERITETEEYYPTRTEARILDEALPILGQRFAGAAIAEFGSGAGVKSRRLIEAVRPSVYVPIDIAEEFLKSSAAELTRRFPDTSVMPVLADFTKAAELPAAFRRSELRMGFFPGSTIGNFDAGGAEAFLSESRATLGDGAWFVVSADLVKDEEILVAAYDDAQGVTRDFNLNVLERMNRELCADFDLSRFRHEARWNADASRIEMHLVSALPQTVTVAGERIDFAEGETIHTENSHKYEPDGFGALARRAGWQVEEAWTDEDDWFGVFLLKAA